MLGYMITIRMYRVIQNVEVTGYRMAVKQVTMYRMGQNVEMIEYKVTFQQWRKAQEMIRYRVAIKQVTMNRVRQNVELSKVQMYSVIVQKLIKRTIVGLTLTKGVQVRKRLVTRYRMITWRRQGMY